jgi:citrate synthase
MYDCVNVDSTINMMSTRLWISAPDASALLGVSRATLYAYVSRGLIRSEATAGSVRERRYAQEDVERLRRRRDERRNPNQAAARALQWGMPVLESSITLIDGDRLYYRGHDVLTLARTRPVAEVAAFIWTGRWTPRFDAAAAPPVADRDARLPFAARAQAMLAAAAGRDAAAADLRLESVAACGWRILQVVTAAAVQRRTAPAALSIDQRLARGWRIGAHGADVLRTAIVLSADHELNVSSFTARCVASAGSDPYAVVIAGLAALAGPKHGGTGARVEAMLAAARGERDVRQAIAARLRRGERIDGFGHPLYPRGDPRATLLLDLLRERYPKSAELRAILRFEASASSVIGERPNLDFGLAAVSRVLQLPPDSPLMLFAIGRTIGWIGHAIEQYALDQIIRPRAKYIGAQPVVESSQCEVGSSK